jgi:hypothetical protein
MKEDFFEKARKLFDMPDLRDKVICFIPEWEKPTFYNLPVEFEEKYFLADQSKALLKARSLLLQQGALSFVVNKEIKANCHNSKLDKEAAEIVEVATKSPSKREYLKRSIQLESLLKDDLEVLPFSEKAPSKRESEILLSKKVNALCIDYQEPAKNFLFEFLKISEGYLKPKPKDKEPLEKLFREASLDVVMFLSNEIKELLERALEGKLTLEDQDKMEYLSASHIQNIPIPLFWDKVKNSGFLCQYNQLDNFQKKEEENNSKEDFRFFYSLEAFLFWELKNRLLVSRRCKNCNYPLPKGFSGSYCQKGSSNFENCHKERLRSRQKKHHQNQSITKT